MRISSKFNLISMTLISITILTVSYVIFSRAEKSLELARLDQLESIAALKVEKIQFLVFERKADAAASQGYFNIKSNLPIMSQYQKDRSAPIYLKAKKMLDDQLRVYQLTHKFLGLMLLNTEGEVVYTANPTHFEREIDRPLSDPNNKAFEEGKKNIYVTEIFEDEVDGLKFFISAPIYDLQKKFIGVVVFGLDLASNFHFILDTTGLGKTGETLIGGKSDNKLLFLSHHRHKSNTNLKSTTDSNVRELGKGEDAYPMRQAVLGKEGHGVSIDYRGKEVLAVWRFIPELNLGLVAKIDIEEAYASITQLKRNIFFVAIVILIITFFLSSWLSKALSSPIIKLSDFAQKVGLGDLTQSITLDSKDEIGQLANSFNKMTTDLKKVTASRDDLNKEITERKLAEDALQKSNEQLLQSQKMESLGIMAGGIAHEFNNILTGISGYAEFLENPALESEEREKYTSGVLKSCDRAKNLVNQILAFSHQHKDEQKPINVEPIVNETIKLIKKTYPTNIKIKYTKKNLNLISANPDNIHQVIMNLCTNAYHAMKDKGGILEIKLNEENLDEKQLSNKPNLKPGSYIHLSISDTGSGVDNNLLNKIFDPFFTTKAVGKGTGLGLSVVHGIIEKHRGKIDVYSEKGKGTIFHIYLPTIKIKKEEKLFEEKIYKGTGKILVIDDEKEVRNVCERMLVNWGYKVHSVNSGLEAIKYYKENKDIDLFLVDIKMPGLDGKATYNALKEIDNNIKALVITGFSSHAYEDLLDIGIKGIVQKPFKKGEFSKIIYETIKIKN